MKLQVEEALKEAGKSFPFSFECPAAELGEVDDLPWKDATVVVDVVQGTIQTSGMYTCSRCLSPVSVDRNETLSEVYGTEAELPEDVLPYNGEYIDLTETIRETLILSEPMRVLCRPDCKGLCPQCGANLNDGPCSCPTDKIDPRLEVLAQLLRSKEKR